MDVHQKASLLPAMEVAHPGASYNPSFADHQVRPQCSKELGELFMLQ